MKKEFETRDESAIAPHLKKQFSNRILPLLPVEFSPNMLTLMGGFSGVITIIIMWMHADTFASPTTNFNAWFLFGALMMLVYAICDQLDGMQARRQKRTGDFGDFLDHWVDALLANLGPMVLVLLIGVENSWVVIFVIATGMAFWGNNWQTAIAYHRRLPQLGGLEFACICACSLILTGLFGREVWDFSIASISLKDLVFYVTLTGLLFGITKNIAQNVNRCYEVMVPLANVACVCLWLLTMSNPDGSEPFQRYLGYTIIGLAFTRYCGDLIRQLWLNVKGVQFDPILIAGGAILLGLTALPASATMSDARLLCLLLITGYCVYRLLWQAHHTYIALTPSVINNVKPQATVSKQAARKRIMADMSAAPLHHGHIRLLQKANELGDIIVGLTSDAELFKAKGINPKPGFAARKEILLSIRYVTEVVETPWLITDDILDQFNIDLLVHGDDNMNDISPERLIILPRTEGISSNDLREGTP